MHRRRLRGQALLGKYAWAIVAEEQAKRVRWRVRPFLSRGGVVSRVLVMVLAATVVVLVGLSCGSLFNSFTNPI